MTKFPRRNFLALGSALFVSLASAAQPDTPAVPAPPRPPTRLPDAWNRASTIALWPGRPPGGTGFAPQSLPPDWSPVFIRNVADPKLHVFRPARPNGKGVLVIPGGAYSFVSVANEGVAVAERLNALGITVFVLTYRLPAEGWTNRTDVPLQDAQRAMRVIRSKASQFGLDQNQVSVLGFSAGGHLAATLATEHSKPAYAAVDELDDVNARPLAVGLIYPVVTMMNPWTHAMSRSLLLGEKVSDAEVERRSPELHVGADTPPIFITHAMDDEAVPVNNSLRLMNALRDAKRPVEAHLLQEGGHAFGIGIPDTPSEHWIALFNTWLNRRSSQA